MRKCACVCACERMCMCVHVCLCVRTCACACMCVRACVCLCDVCTYACTRVRVCAHACLRKGLCRTWVGVWREDIKRIMIMINGYLLFSLVQRGGVSEGRKKNMLGRVSQGPFIYAIPCNPLDEYCPIFMNE